MVKKKKERKEGLVVNKETGKLNKEKKKYR